MPTADEALCPSALACKLESHGGLLPLAFLDFYETITCCQSVRWSQTDSKFVETAPESAFETADSTPETALGCFQGVSRTDPQPISPSFESV
jgi:hypothetical protein